MEISIGMLAWKSAKTLRNTLRSYKKNGLLGVTDDFTVLFQEVSHEDKSIAEEFGVKYIGSQENIGIGKGILKLAENAKYSKFLFLEHDWELVEDEAVVRERLKSGLEMLKNGFQVVRYRSRKKPGVPLYSTAYKGKELEFYDDWHKVTSPHLLESLHWLDPAKEFSDKIQKSGEYFVTTSRWANWTNNPFLIDRDFYLETIYKFSDEGVHFEKNIAPWWVLQDFKIAQGEGLFTHNDFVKYPPKSLASKIKSKLKKLFKL